MEEKEMEMDLGEGLDAQGWSRRQGTSRSLASWQKEQDSPEGRRRPNASHFPDPPQIIVHRTTEG